MVKGDKYQSLTILLVHKCYKTKRYEMSKKFCVRRSAKPALRFSGWHLKFADTFNFLCLEMPSILETKNSTGLPWKVVIKSVQLYKFDNHHRNTREENMYTSFGSGQEYHAQKSICRVVYQTTFYHCSLTEYNPSCAVTANMAVILFSGFTKR